MAWPHCLTFCNQAAYALFFLAYVIWRNNEMKSWKTGNGCCVVFLSLGFGALLGDWRIHPHPEYPDCAHQDPAVLPQSAEPGASPGTQGAQDLPGGEGEEAWSLCVGYGVTEWPTIEWYYNTLRFSVYTVHVKTQAENTILISFFFSSHYIFWFEICCSITEAYSSFPLKLSAEFDVIFCLVPACCLLTFWFSNMKMSSVSPL